MLKKGDELYEAEFCEELSHDTTIEVEIQYIVLQLLHDFSFLNENEEYNHGGNEDEEEAEGDNAQSPICYVHN
jgi:hypothetical protein